MVRLSFPDHWGYRRISEVKVAIYACLLGLMVVVYPGLFDDPIYSDLGGRDAATPIATLSLMLAALHSGALWLNGRKPEVSRIVRIVACIGHMTVVCFFMIYFVRYGDPWKALLMSYVLFGVYSALQRACKTGCYARV